MKKLFFPLLLLALILPPAFAVNPGSAWLDVRLIISHTTTAEDLSRMQKFMSDNGYELEIEERIFNEQGQLLSVRGKVDFGLASGTFYASDLRRSTVFIKKSFFSNLQISVRPKKC